MTVFFKDYRELTVILGNGLAGGRGSENIETREIFYMSPSGYKEIFKDSEHFKENMKLRYGASVQVVFGNSFRETTDL